MDTKECTLYCFSVFAAIIIFAIMGFKAHTTYDACLVEQASNSSLECDLQQELEKSARYSGTVKPHYTELYGQWNGSCVHPVHGRGQPVPVVQHLVDPFLLYG